MQDKITVQMEQGTIICHKSYSGKTEKSNSINLKLDRLRFMLRNMKYSKDLSKVDYELYVYESKLVNAFSKKEGSGYIIAISSYLLYDIIDEIKNYMLNSDIRNYFYGRKKNASKHAERIHDYILQYVVLHENYHILNGHCDWVYSVNYATVQKRTLDFEGNFYKQVIEMDADYCAVRSIIYLLDEKTDREELNTEIVLVGFSLYFIFLKFQEESYENITTIDIKQFDHPPASVRVIYSISVMMKYLVDIVDKIQLLYVMENMTEVCIYFDRIYYDSDTIEQALFAYAYTPTGQEYMKELFNGWNKIKDKLSHLAYISLRNESTSELENKYFLNNDGNLLRIMNMEKRENEFYDAVRKL